MAVLLLYLLLVPPVLSIGTYEKFKRQHMYVGNSLPDCTPHMNAVLKSLNMGCKACNSIILGDSSYTTDQNDVTEVCSRGVSRGNNMYESRTEFRMVKCSLMTGTQPPNCVYKKVTERNIQSKKLLLTCENRRPVHFNPC